MTGMKYIEDVCDVCGGHAVTLAGQFHKRWLGARFAHKNPDVCREFLEKKAREIDRRGAAYKYADSMLKTREQ